MTQANETPVAAPADDVSDTPAADLPGGRLLGALRDVVMRFILPVAGLGVTLWGVEEILLGFGIHGDVVKILRLGVLPIYGVMVWRMMKGRPRT